MPGTGVSVHAQRSDGRLDLELHGDLEPDDAPTIDAVHRALVELGATEVGTEEADVEARLIAPHPPDRVLALPTALAARLGLTRIRDLLQLRRPLPVPDDDPARAGAPRLALRPFDPSVDGDAWIRANNRAFATHPDQGDQTPDRLAATLAEPWVDLPGFLVADDPDRPGDLVGSCWTKVHPPEGADPALGEIFVIGVDPRHHGRGLGRTLVLAGLDHLAAQGLRTAMLYVEADNDPALRLYDHLGFTPHLRHRICSR